MFRNARNLVLACSVAAAVCGPLDGGARPEKAVIAVTPKQVAVDGRAAPGEWPTDSIRPLLCVLPACGEPSEYITRAWAAFDGASLYLLVVTEVDPGTRLVMDGNWGARDGLEIAFRDPRDAKAPIWSGYGYPDGMFKGHAVGGAPVEDAQLLEKAVSYAASVEADRWVAEFRIQLDRLSIAVDDLEKLDFNLNIRRRCDKTWIVWVPTDGAVWEVDSAGVLDAGRGTRGGGAGDVCRSATQARLAVPFRPGWAGGEGRLGEGPGRGGMGAEPGCPAGRHGGVQGLRRLGLVPAGRHAFGACA